MKEPERRPLKGTMSWSDAKDMHITVAIDRIAISNNCLAMISCVGYANEIKALRAALAVGAQSMMTLRGPAEASLTAREGTVAVSLNHAYVLAGSKYHGQTHRLGYNALHALFVARLPGLMLDATDPALWRELGQPCYTTPLLRGWLPHLRRELVQAGKLVHLACVDCDCMRLAATTKDLDDIVSHGLKNGHLAITKEDAA